jgi:hypothetical protein
MNDPGICAECGHLHFEGSLYSDCPIEGCRCQGQTSDGRRIDMDTLSHRDPYHRGVQPS